MKPDEIKIQIRDAIAAFSKGNLTVNSMHLFQTLGYNTQRNAHLNKPDYKTFKESFLGFNSNFNESKAFTSEWKYIDLLFQLSKSEVSKQTTLFDTIKVDNTLIETYLFFAIALTGNHYTRGNLSSITREFNKVFPMPVMILFRHNNSLTLSVINRRIHKRDESKDVLEKVTLIKDIDIANPHRAHIEILFDLSFEQLKYKHNFTNFVELHEAWQKTLDTKELNKKFFQELANWYYWAISKTNWPDDDEQLKKKEIRNATNVIRLITRLIFIWFLKEKKLVDSILFNEKELKSILNYSDKNDSTYYKAILQNLFFATLNTPLDKRTFRTKRNYQGKNTDRGNPFVFRYENYFIKDITELYEHIPFLNGGLFDCLDYKDEKGNMVHIDGFSEEKNNPIKIPDYLFFCKPKTIDLSEIYNDKKKSKSEVRGLINILDSYKFTITENTPIEEEVALDPELLGRVFENLLAYYNPETETTARKQTGSFYTPREIVNYMVDESLIAYLKTNMLAESFSFIEIGSDQMDFVGNKARKGQLKIEEVVNPNRWIGKEENLENELRSLLSYSEAELHFNSEEKKALVKAIDNIKVLDPACGSGAFPMGVLHKLVHILHKLDPQNQIWKQKQIEFASQIQESSARENALKNIEDVFNPENNFADYGRKLFLIRNCIYGIDIQPIAIQIAKLRFFISLLIDQAINNKINNHNIDPLPNLESKFVCANTLIGLQKSTSTGNLFDENYEKIVELKSKFAEIRKNYFNIKLPQEKKKLHDLYLKTRDELINILKKDKGYSVDAPLMVQYDPYNPLNVSPFFDVEWMFGFNGFDIVIGNPPYDVYQGYRKDEIDIIKNQSIYNLSKGGKLNAYKLFIAKSYELQNTGGFICQIFQNSFLADASAKNLRQFFLNNQKIIKIDSFPERDDVNKRVFPGVKMSTCIMLSNNISSKLYNFNLTVYKDRNFNNPQLVSYSNQEIENIDPIGYTILSVNKKEKPIFISIAKNNRLSEYGRCYEGEINLTFHKKYLSTSNTDKAKMIKGAAVQKYFIKSKMSQGEIEYLDKNKYLKDNSGAKTQHHKQIRIVMQGITGVDETYRLKMTMLGKNIFCGNSVNYILLNDDTYSKEYLLGILNSTLMNWYFKKMSTNSNVNGYEVDSLPINFNSNFDETIHNVVSYLLYIKSQKIKNDVHAIYYEKLVDGLAYELYFPSLLKEADCELLKHLNNLPELKDDWSDDKKLKTIEKVYKELSDKNHPVRIAMFKMDTIEEIRIIEGKQ